MSMDQSLPAFFEELEKLGVSKGDSFFMQSRKGRRPIRAHKLLEKETAFSRPQKEEGGSDLSSDYEREYGGGMEDKVAAAKKDSLERKAIRGAVSARPWVSSAVRGAIPAAVASNFLIPATSAKGVKYKSRIVAGMGLLGAGAGVADRALKNWSKRNPRTAEARKLEKQGAATMRKVAAMAADLRRSGIGGVKRPPFATEDSKQFAFNQLNNSKAPGYFTTQTQPKHLRRPGPSIQQIATTPGG